MANLYETIGAIEHDCNRVRAALLDNPKRDAKEAVHIIKDRFQQMAQRIDGALQQLDIVEVAADNLKELTDNG